MGVSLAISALFLLFVNAVAYSGKGTGAGRATACSVVGAFLLSCISTLALPLNALAVAVTGAVCWWTKARPRWFLVSSLSATVAVYVLITVLTLRAWDRLKKDYPMASLASRLGYEDRNHILTPAVGERSSPAAKHLVALETRLEQETSRYGRDFRTRSLERLHDGVVEQFIDSPGFGVGRMIARPNPFYLERERQGPEEPIPQLIPSIQPIDLTPAPVRVASGTDLQTVHDDNTLDFLNPLGFGYIRDREHVAGFRPHQFRESPRAPRWRRVNRLELVGLLKHEEPVVYLSSNLPRMDELSEAPTRSLDGFEKEALARLQRGEDLMVQEASSQMRMLGSIRAGQQCLRCHQVQRGELLGAFSYQMAAD
jgi:hypothetical protein